jgi:type II secretory pathway component HofQ
MTPLARGENQALQSRGVARVNREIRAKLSLANANHQPTMITTQNDEHVVLVKMAKPNTLLLRRGS